MKAYKARGHKTFASSRNPFVIAKPKTASHSGKRWANRTSYFQKSMEQRGHTGQKRRSSQQPTGGVPHKAYRSGWKKAIPSSPLPLPTKAAYRSSPQGRRHKIKMTVLARRGYTGSKHKAISLPMPHVSHSNYSGGGGSRHKIKMLVLARRQYRGNRNSHHKASLPPVPRKGYGGGGTTHKASLPAVPSKGYSGGGTKHSSFIPRTPAKGYAGSKNKHSSTIPVPWKLPYSGSKSHRHKVKQRVLVERKYRSGATGKKYRVKPKPIPQHSSKQFGKKYRVKYTAPTVTRYRSGKGGLKHKSGIRTLPAPIYRSGVNGKKYRILTKSPSKTGYTGGRKPKGNTVKVVVSVPYRSGSMSGNQPKKPFDLYQKKPYRKGTQVHKYKVKSVKKVKETQRKRNATAARTKKLAYLQKNIKGKKRKKGVNGDYQGHWSMEQILRMIILVLMIMIGISLFILALTKDEWMDENPQIQPVSSFSEKSNKIFLKNVKEL